VLTLHQNSVNILALKEEKEGEGEEEKRKKGGEGKLRGRENSAPGATVARRASN